MEDTRLVPVFCGYPNADAARRWAQMRESSGHHWLKTHDPATAINWLEQQIRESVAYRDECAAHGVEFVDCSDLENATRNIVRKMDELLR